MSIMSFENVGSAGAARAGNTRFGGGRARDGETAAERGALRERERRRPPGDPGAPLPRGRAQGAQGTRLRPPRRRRSARDLFARALRFHVGGHPRTSGDQGAPGDRGRHASACPCPRENAARASRSRAEGETPRRAHGVRSPWLAARPESFARESTVAVPLDTGYMREVTSPATVVVRKMIQSCPSKRRPGPRACVRACARV